MFRAGIFHEHFLVVQFADSHRPGREDARQVAQWRKQLAVQLAAQLAAQLAVRLAVQLAVQLTGGGSSPRPTAPQVPQKTACAIT